MTGRRAHPLDSMEQWVPGTRVARRARMEEKNGAEQVSDGTDARFWPF